MARHHRAAEGQRAVAAACDLHDGHGVARTAWRRHRKRPQRYRQAVGSTARPDHRRLAEHQHVGQLGAWMPPGSAGRQPLRRPPDRQHVLDFGSGQQTGVGELRHQCARDDNRVATIVAGLSGEDVGVEAVMQR